MPVQSLSFTVPAARAVVFRHLANIENLPQWAPGFCEALALSHRGWFALTALGELYLELEADEHTGVIDLRAGDDGEVRTLLPMRVVALPEGGCAVVVLLSATRTQTPAQFAEFCATMAGELARLGERFRSEAAWPESVVSASQACAGVS